MTINLRDADQRSQLADDLRRRLVADTAPSEHLADYLEYFARLRTAGLRSGMRGFGAYSANNLFLLALQERQHGESHRGLYAGVAQWRTLGRSIRPGSRAKFIWAFVPPVTSAGKDVDDQDAATATPRKRFPFRLVEVYDYTDTVDPDGGPDPDWAVPMHIGSDELYERLEATSPIPVVARTLTGGEHGFLTRTEIVVDADQLPGNRLATLVHELAHEACGHLDRIAVEGEAARAACEQEAELAVFLFFKSVGLDEAVGNDVTTATLDYLRSWTRDGKDVAGHKARVELLHERVEVAWTAVERILTRLDITVPAAETCAV